MNKKRKPRTRVSTSYSNLTSKMRNVSLLANSLGTGSKNRLRQYQSNLAVTRGLDSRFLDKPVLSLLKEYAYDKHSVNKEVNYLDQLVCEDGYKFSRNLKIYSTTEDAMERFQQEDFTSFRWDPCYRKSLKKLEEEFSKLNFRPAHIGSDTDVENLLPKVDTHSGWTYIQTGKKKKGANLEGSFIRFKKARDQAIKDGSFNSPILIGFRTQASGEYEDDGSQTGTGKHKLRVVSMVDMNVILAELCFAKPIQNYLAQVDYYAGGKDPDTISSIITNHRKNYKKFMSIDYSSFDQTISSWLIEDAFGVIKKAFRNLYNWESKLFDVIVNDFIHKDFVLSEGILHSDKGVPSGSMFTQIIDSLVNWLVVNTYFEIHQSKCDMIIMGDDNVIFTSDDVSLLQLSDFIGKKFGLVVKVDDKSSEGYCNSDDVKFLSRYWRFDGQWRHPNQLISRLLYPERKRIYTDEVGPEHVLFAFILTYKLGMMQLIDINRFMHDYQISKKYVLKHVDSRYLPGALAYIREYT